MDSCRVYTPGSHRVCTRRTAYVSHQGKQTYVCSACLTLSRHLLSVKDLEHGSLGSAPHDVVMSEPTQAGRCVARSRRACLHSCITCCCAGSWAGRLAGRLPTQCLAGDCGAGLESWRCLCLSSSDSIRAMTARLQVGDDPVTHLTDMRTGGSVATLAAHADYSFAAAWHPDGKLLATGAMRLA